MKLKKLSKSIYVCVFTLLFSIISEKNSDLFTYSMVYHRIQTACSSGENSEKKPFPNEMRSCHNTEFIELSTVPTNSQCKYSRWPNINQNNFPLSALVSSLFRSPLVFNDGFDAEKNDVKRILNFVLVADFHAINGDGTERKKYVTIKKRWGEEEEKHLIYMFCHIHTRRRQSEIERRNQIKFVAVIWRKSIGRVFFSPFGQLCMPWDFVDCAEWVHRTGDTVFAANTHKTSSEFRIRIGGLSQ